VPFSAIRIISFACHRRLRRRPNRQDERSAAIRLCNFGSWIPSVDGILPPKCSSDRQVSPTLRVLRASTNPSSSAAVLKISSVRVDPYEIGGQQSYNASLGRDRRRAPSTRRRAKFTALQRFARIVCDTERGLRMMSNTFQRGRHKAVARIPTVTRQTGPDRRPRIVQAPRSHDRSQSG
jgi:hypothetical protein